MFKSYVRKQTSTNFCTILTSSPRTIFYGKIRPAEKIRCQPLYLQFINLKNYFGNKAAENNYMLHHC